MSNSGRIKVYEGRLIKKLFSGRFTTPKKGGQGNCGGEEDSKEKRMRESAPQSARGGGRKRASGVGKA